jgi:hypothetical protein
LDKLKTALNTHNGELFKEVMDSLYSDENVTMDDVEAIIEPAMQKDPDGTLEFMRENHPENWPVEEEAAGKGKTIHESGGVYSDEGERIFKQSWYYDRRFFYFMFRMTGMGYGPGLRTLKTGFRQGEISSTPGNLAFGVSTMQLKDDHDDWEENTGWHPGLHDCALQTGSVRGYPLKICTDMTTYAPGDYHYHPDTRYTST